LKCRKGRDHLNTLHPEEKYLIHLLYSVLHDTHPQEPPENLDWEKVYKLSVLHSVANMVYYGINRLNAGQKPSCEIIKKFQHDFKKAIAKEAVQNTSAEKLLEAFEKNQIDCMPLKGYQVKHLYPQPDMRMMADIDILYKPDEKNLVTQLMQDSGYTLKHTGENHDSYYREPFMNIEMHHRLISENSPYSRYLSKVWDRARPKDGYRHIWQLSEEDLFIYLMIHLTKHYVRGGTGIRSFMDIWVYLRHYENKLDWNYILSELEQIKLRKFSENIIGLGNAWFGNEQSNELFDEMAKYIFSSGAYGTEKNHIVFELNSNTDIKRSITSTKLLYRLKLFFPGIKHMKILYPFLGTMPFLLPVCWVLRGLKSVLFKCERTFQIINTVSSVSAQDVARIQDLHKRAGL